MVKDVKELRLNGIEVGEGIERFPEGVLQRRHRQRFQVEHVRVRRMPIGQDQVLEVDWVGGLAAHPSVADDADVVLRWKRLENRNREHDELMGKKKRNVWI